MSDRNLTRRSFMKVAAGTGAGLVLGACVPAKALTRTNKKAAKSESNFAPNVWVAVDPSGIVSITVSKVEIGQGVRTGLAMIVADELEVDWKDVSYAQGPAGKEFINPAIGNQITGGSSSVKGFFDPLRKAAATVREMLISAAAQQWGVSPETLRARNGEVFQPNSSLRLKYGALLEAASKITPPAEPKLKDPKDFKYIGKSITSQKI